MKLIQIIQLIRKGIAVKYSALLIVPVLALLAAGCSSQKDEINRRYIDAHRGMRVQPATPTPGQPPITHVGAPDNWTPAPAPTPMLAAKVVIDPGHGGKDPGTRSAAGATEKNINLAVALAAAKYLREKGIQVVLTRGNDTFVELSERADRANRCGAQLFVSIHSDYNRDSSKKGHTILLPQDNSPQTNRLANLISANMATAGSPAHSLREDDRGLYVLKHTDCTSVLVELGFLSNKTEAAALAGADNEARLGKAIAEGILEYLQGRKP